VLVSGGERSGIGEDVRSGKDRKVGKTRETGVGNDSNKTEQEGTMKYGEAKRGTGITFQPTYPREAGNMKRQEAGVGGVQQRGNRK